MKTYAGSSLRLRAATAVAAGWLALIQSPVSGAAAPAEEREASSYPYRPIRFIEAFGAGGTTDYLARVVGQKLTERFGQQIVVDNRPGAGGNIGAEMAAKAAPDGYTLFMGVVPILAAARSMYARLGYDPVKDFDGITGLVAGNYVLVVGSSVPVKSVQDLIRLARSKPGQLRYGSSGVGSTLHLAMEMLKSMASLDLLHVPYKGGPPMVAAIAAGEVEVGTPSLTLGLPLIKAGRLHPIAVTGAKRAREFPQLPTIAESGVPGYDLTPWYASFAPAGTPRAVVALLSAEINRIIQLPELQAGFAAQGLEASGSTPERLKQILQAETEKWGQVIRSANIKAE